MFGSVHHELKPQTEGPNTSSMLNDLIVSFFQDLHIKPQQAQISKVEQLIASMSSFKSTALVGPPLSSKSTVVKVCLRYLREEQDESCPDAPLAMELDPSSYTDEELYGSKYIDRTLHQSHQSSASLSPQAEQHQHIQGDNASQGIRERGDTSSIFEGIPYSEHRKVISLPSFTLNANLMESFANHIS